ncbi:MAG: UxaA family hydrolase, partial [Gammaproteobacteria bacterium]
DLSRFGFASVQLDGGIEEVGSKVGEWFDEALTEDGALERVSASAAAITLGLTATAAGSGATGVSGPVAEALARLATGIVAAGGSVVLPENSSLLAMERFTRELLADGARADATLAYGVPAEAPGLHVMEAPTESMLETVTGLGGTGVNVMLVHLGRSPVPTHPMIPVLQVSAEPLVKACYGGDLDLALDPGAPADAVLRALADRLCECAGGSYRPHLSAAGMTGFQLTRGLLGISM